MVSALSSYGYPNHVVLTRHEEPVGIIGLFGTGKCTLLKNIAGLLAPDK